MIPLGSKQGIKLHRGLRTQGNSNNPLLLRMDLGEVGNNWYQQWGGGFYPWFGTLWHRLERQGGRLCSVDDGTRSCSGSGTEGYFWMSILLYFGQWWITWTRKKITSPDNTLGKSCVGNDYFNPLWQILFTFGLEDNGVAGAKECTQPSKLIKAEDNHAV